MIARLLAILRIDHTTDYCSNCGGHYPASHFPCD